MLTDTATNNCEIKRNSELLVAADFTLDVLNFSDVPKGRQPCVCPCTLFAISGLNDVYCMIYSESYEKNYHK